MLHYPQQILWIIKSVQALVMPVVSFPLFLLPHLPFTCFFPIDLLQPRLNARVCTARLELQSEHPSNHHPTKSSNPQACSIIKGEMKWEKRMSAGTALSLWLRFPHRHEEEAHSACPDRSAAFHTMSVPAGFHDYSGAARMTSVGLP